jgi:hypothetical protein
MLSRTTPQELEKTKANLNLKECFDITYFGKIVLVGEFIENLISNILWIQKSLSINIL